MRFSSPERRSSSFVRKEERKDQRPALSGSSGGSSSRRRSSFSPLTLVRGRDIAETGALLRLGFAAVSLELDLEIGDFALQVALASQGGVEVGLVAVCGLAGESLGATGFLLGLLELGDAAAEEVVDDFEFGDAGFQVAVAAGELAVGCGWFEVGAVEGRCRGRRLAKCELWDGRGLE